MGIKTKSIDYEEATILSVIFATCKKHPKYKALLKPRCSCKECHELYSKRRN